MRFFVRMTERSTADPQELVAMLLHRLNSIKYHQELLEASVLAYAFRAHNGRVAINLFEVDSLQVLDRHIKRDPQFPFSEVEVIPLISTVDMVQEASEYLGETILTSEELSSLDFPVKRLNPMRTYWLAWKEVRPFSPLLPEEIQNDVHRRTVTSQKAHHSALEFADDNPVGKAIGILVAEGDLKAVEAHVSNCEVYPDTVVSFTELEHLHTTLKKAMENLARLGRPVTNTISSYIGATK